MRNSAVCAVFRVKTPISVQSVSAVCPARDWSGKKRLRRRRPRMAKRRKKRKKGKRSARIRMGWDGRLSVSTVAAEGARAVTNGQHGLHGRRFGGFFFF